MPSPVSACTPKGGQKTKMERHNTEYEREESIADRSESIDELAVHSSVIGSEDSNGTEHLRFENASALL